jgi:hypothetical protein
MTLSNSHTRSIALAYGSEVQLNRIAAAIRTNFKLAKLAGDDEARQIKIDASQSLLDAFGASDPANFPGSLHLALPLFFDYQLINRSSHYLDLELQRELEDLLSSKFSVSIDHLLSLREKFFDEHPLHKIQPISGVVEKIASELERSDDPLTYPNGHQIADATIPDLRGFEKMRFHLKSISSQLLEGFGLLFWIIFFIGVAVALKYFLRH